MNRISTTRHDRRRHRRRAAATVVTATAVALVGLAPAARAAGPLDVWHAAVAGRDTAPATWLAMGDSVVEGQGASALARRWINQTTDRLRQSYPTTGAPGGVGYLAGWDYLYGPDSTWTPYTRRSGTVSNVSNVTSFGELTARLSRGASQTYTITGTSADVYYDTVSTGGTLTYRVDSGATRSVSTAGTTRPDNVIHLAFGGTGTHTVTVGSSSGTVYLEGVRGYSGDETKGVRLVADAHAGYSSASYLSDRTNRNRLIAQAAPALVTIDWGANDYLNAVATPAQLTANLRSEISNLRSVLTSGTPSIAVVLPYSMGTSRNSLGYTWSDYAAAIRAVPAGDATVGLLDLSSMPLTGGNLSGDGIHPTDAGQGVLAGLAAAYLG